MAQRCSLITLWSCEKKRPRERRRGRYMCPHRLLFARGCRPKERQLGAGGEFVEELYVGARGAIQALDLGVGGFDYVVFVGGVGAAAVAKTEVAGGKTQRFAGEDVAGPGAGVARQ